MIFLVVKSLKNLKVLTTGSQTISAQIKADVEKYLKKSELEELMRIKDGDQTVKFYVKEGKDENHVKELLMFVSGLKEMTKEDDPEIVEMARMELDEIKPLIPQYEEELKILLLVFSFLFIFFILPL